MLKTKKEEDLEKDHIVEESEGLEKTRANLTTEAEEALLRQEKASIAASINYNPITPVDSGRIIIKIAELPEEGASDVDAENDLQGGGEYVFEKTL